MKPQIVNAKMNRELLKSRIVKVGLFFAVAASIVLMTGSVSLHDSVYITDEGQTKHVKTNETDIYSILRTEDYELGANDRVSYTRDENNSGHITIYRAFEVNVNADGMTHSFATVGGDVSDALEALDLELKEEDIIDYEYTDELFPDMKITVTRIDHEEWQEEVEIPYETEYIDNPNHTIGYEEILTYGENGVRTIHYRDTLVDGEVTDTAELYDEVTVEPVNMVIERGSATAHPYSETFSEGNVVLVNGVPTSYTRVLSGKSTAYTAYPGAGTASGRPAKVGNVAVNPNVIPYGSELYIVSQDGSRVYGYAIAADTGGALLNGHALVDLYMDTYEDCCSWGAVYVDVYVLSEGNG